MPASSRFTDAQLEEAIRVSTSWRGVLRNLGTTSSSGKMIASLRRRADGVNAQYGHFGMLRPPEGDDMKDELSSPAVSTTTEERPNIANLSAAGSMIAASWFALCGLTVSWPLEPCRFDLLVSHGGTGAARRVQVKTTTTRSGGSWKAYLSTMSGGRHSYSADEIDEFFIVDGDLSCYSIPLSVVAGVHAIHLSAYHAFRVFSPVPSEAARDHADVSDPAPISVA